MFNQASVAKGEKATRVEIQNNPQISRFNTVLSEYAALKGMHADHVKLPLQTVDRADKLAAAIEEAIRRRSEVLRRRRAAQDLNFQNVHERENFTASQKGNTPSNSGERAEHRVPVAVGRRRKLPAALEALREMQVFYGATYAAGGQAILSVDTQLAHRSGVLLGFAMGLGLGMGFVLLLLAALGG